MARLRVQDQTKRPQISGPRRARRRALREGLRRDVIGGCPRRTFSTRGLARRPTFNDERALLHPFRMYLLRLAESVVDRNSSLLVLLQSYGRLDHRELLGVRRFQRYQFRVVGPSQRFDGVVVAALPIGERLLHELVECPGFFFFFVGVFPSKDAL